MKYENKIEHIKPFNELFYRYCLNNSLFPILNERGGSCLSVLVNDVPFYNFAMDRDQVLPRLEVQYNSALSLERLLELHGIGFHQKSVCDDVVEAVVEDIDEGRPVIVWIDCYYEKIRNDTFLKKHLSHTWLIHGYNKIDRVAHIIEHIYRDSLSYEGRTISLSDLVNCYDGYIVLNKQTCGMPRFYECQNECGYYNTDDYYVRCGFPKYNNFSNKLDIPSYMSFDISKKDNSYFNGKRCLQMYLTNMEKNFEIISHGLLDLSKYVQWLKPILLSECLLRQYSEQIVMDINGIVNAKLADQYKNNHLFGPQSELYLKVGQIVHLYQTVRSVITKFTFSQVYDKQKMESLLSILTGILEAECDYYSKFTSLCKLH